MVIHYYDKEKENKNLCNTKTKNINTENKNEITCKKCKFILTSNELKETYDEKKIIAQDIKQSKLF